MNSQQYVQIKNLSFGFKNKTPLFEGLSLNIEKGQCLGITGASGSGKSTLAQIIAGHLRPDNGEIIIDGQVETGKPQRDIFLVHQDSDLFPWLTVRKQIAFGMKSPDKKRVDQLLKMAKLSSFENYYPSQLSGGMKKRLSIARALAVNPKLIIFDESFNSLDIDLRKEIFKDLKEIWHLTKMTILLISHDPRDLDEVAEREIRL